MSSHGGRGLARLKLKCPDIRASLDAHYSTDDNLRALSAAYEDANQALEARRIAIRRTAAEIADYSQVIDAMEEEIRSRLRRQSTNPAGARPDDGVPWFRQLLRHFSQAFGT